MITSESHSRIELSNQTSLKKRVARLVANNSNNAIDEGFRIFFWLGGHNLTLGISDDHINTNFSSIWKKQLHQSLS